MARLITCKVCSTQISSDAETCPNCNHPHEKDRIQNKNNKQLIWIMVLLFLFVILLKTGLFQKIINLFINSIKN